MNTTTCRYLLALTAGLALVAATAAGATPASVRPTQQLVVLLRAHGAYAAPSVQSALLGSVRTRRPLTGEPTVLPVIARRVGADGLRWLRVRLPGRPNGLTGWIRERGSVSTATSWHVVVATSSHRVFAYRNGRLVRAFDAIVGKPSTPTPVGRFFVEEIVHVPAGGPGAPYAFALSARSDVLQEFAGGPGQIALHGVANIGGVLGTAVSHGCVRLDTDAIRWLAERIGRGVPVTIMAK